MARRLRGLRFSFEPADIVNQIMSFGSPTPIEISVSGPNFADDQAHARKVFAELSRIPSLRDLQYGQSLDYPAVAVKIDREKAGLSGVTAADVARSLVSATSSSRFVEPIFWADPSTGIGYYTQVEIPPYRMNSPSEIGVVPIQGKAGGELLVRDVAEVREGTMPGEYDRYNMRRLVTITANIEGEDLGRVIRHVNQALRAGRRAAPRRAGRHPRPGGADGANVPRLDRGPGPGDGRSSSCCLTAYFQSLRLAVISASAIPAVIAGVAGALALTGTTLNLQSFMGTIMAIGVATANAILLLTFAERSRRDGHVLAGGGGRGRPEPAAPDLDDQLRHAGRYGPDGLGPGRRGRADCPLGTGGHRRPRRRNLGHAARPPQRLCHRSGSGRHNFFFLAPR